MFACPTTATKMVALVTSIVAGVMCALQFAKEFFQLIKTGWNYFLSLENLAEISLISSTLGILVPFWIELFWEGWDVQEAAFVRSLSAFAVILSWALVFFVIGRQGCWKIMIF